MHEIELVSVDAIKPNPRNAHTHSKKQIGQIADSIDAFGFTVPVIIDEASTLLAGHGRFEAAKLRGLKKIPAIRLHGLSEAKKRALLLADNKIAANAGWDRERLAIELPELTELLIAESLDISMTGFEPVEIDTLVSDFEESAADPADEIQTDWLSVTPVSRLGDLWQLGPHRLLCGDARDASNLDRLIGDEQAAMAFLDPPYNMKIASVVGRGRTKHSEFAMASGEISRPDYVVIAQTDLFAGGSVRLPQRASWLEEFVAELLAFPGGHDDQVDALTQGLAWGRQWWSRKAKTGFVLGLN